MTMARLRSSIVVRRRPTRDESADGLSAHLRLQSIERLSHHDKDSALWQIAKRGLALFLFATAVNAMSLRLHILEGSILN